MHAYMYHVQTSPMQDIATSTLMQQFCKYQKHTVAVKNGMLIVKIRDPEGSKNDFVEFRVQPVTFAEEAYQSGTLDRTHPTYEVGSFEIAPDEKNIVAIVPESNELGFLYTPIDTYRYETLRPCVTMTYADVTKGGDQLLPPCEKVVFRNITNSSTGTTFPRGYSVARGRGRPGFGAVERKGERVCLPGA